MRDVVVTLLSQKPCEISDFLKLYFSKEIIIDECAFKWSCFYNRPYETIEILSTLIDNNDKFKIETILTLNKVATIKITDENINEIVRLFLHTQ